MDYTKSYTVYIMFLPADYAVEIQHFGHEFMRTCSPMARETWVQSQAESYQRLKK